MDSNKWLATVASIWIQCSCGASYAFGIYSSVLKSSQGYDQSTLDTVSVFKDIGANAGIISGLFYSSVFVRRRGPWLVHVAGALQCFAGYLLLWLSVKGIINRPPLPVMCLFMLMASHAQTFFNTANVVTAVHNFPDYSGTIVGIMKGFLGLSGAVLIQVYRSFFSGSPSTFLLMMSFFPTTVTLLFMFLVRIYPTEHKGESEKKHLNGFSSVALVLAAYLLTLIILENLFTLPLWAHILTFVILMVILVSPFVIVLRAQGGEKNKIPNKIQQLPSNENSQLPNEEQAEDNLHHIKDMNLLQSARTINFWLLFIAMLCGMGSGLSTINNITQIGQSLGYKTVQINTLLSSWSIWNFLGRFGAGYISDIFLYNYGLGRPLLMVLTLATMTIGHVIIASGFSGNLYIGSVIVGICYGSQWSLMPTITSEIFGITHMGTIFNTVGVASPVGSFFLSVLVIGHIYDKQAPAKGKSCYGKKCFMVSFFVFACVSMLGFIASLVLFFRTRGSYKKLVATRKSNLAKG